MKAEANEKTGLLPSLIGAVTRNWGLKILSLLLAILIYHTLKPTSGKDPLPSVPGAAAPVAPTVARPAAAPGVTAPAAPTVRRPAAAPTSK